MRLLDSQQFLYIIVKDMRNQVAVEVLIGRLFSLSFSVCGVLLSSCQRVVRVLGLGCEVRPAVVNRRLEGGGLRAFLALYFYRFSASSGACESLQAKRSGERSRCPRRC